VIPLGCARWVLRARRWALLLVFACVLAACGGEPKTVVLIGGPASEGPGRHAYPDGIRQLQALLEQDASDRVRVDAYPDGWPADPSVLARADTVVLYFDGLDRHPLRDPAHRAAFEAAMRRGSGVVALHQASTVPESDDLGLARWLGAVRVGTFDRTTQWATLTPSASHPVSAGMAPFSYRDEFYPTFRAAAAGRRTPLLQGVLHPQFRDGAPVLDDLAEDTDVAWAYEREGGGRAVVFSGAHYLDVLKHPSVRHLLLNAVLWTAHAEVADAPVIPADASRARVATGDAGTVQRATFHVDAGRSGWRRDEPTLTPAVVGAKDFGLVWESPKLDADGGSDARLYASPLYVDRLAITAGPQTGERFDVVIAASNNGHVYAVNASRQGDVAPGRILWTTRLGEPCRLQPAPLDGVPTGILSTPVIDVAQGRLYVTQCDPEHRWQAYALELGSGRVLPGWPVKLDEATFNDLNTNAGPSRVPPKRKFDFRVQRGALNLSPDGAQLYVVFGESETGWIAAVDTRRARVSSAFAAVAMPHRGSGGIWGAGGPAVDADGHVYVVTGSGFGGYQDSDGDWAQSVLKLAPPATQGFALRGTYTPFNYCTSAEKDIDLGSGGIALLPASAGAPRLLTVGGKQGNVYLLDRDRLPGKLARRPPCSPDAASDGSLLAPTPQRQFATRGPLNVFGPYSEDDAALDLARARSVPAVFRAADGSEYVYVTGNTKQAPGSSTSIAPSVVRLRVDRATPATPFLRVDRANPSLVLGNPGSPVVTSRGADDALLWILDENAPRSASLHGTDAPRPVLYALDAQSLEVVWRSAPGELFTSGKYNEPAFGGGQVFVGTDRIQAFGAGGRRITDRQPVARKAHVVVDPALAGVPAATLYAQRCAACHDHAQGNIPPRAVIATRPHSRIVDALAQGVMRPHAQGLSARQIDELARYVKQ
jgi:outer membrane protein assembly factor BamB/type 1 glutamine amidotransferase